MDVWTADHEHTVTVPRLTKNEASGTRKKEEATRERTVSVSRGGPWTRSCQHEVVYSYMIKFEIDVLAI